MENFKMDIIFDGSPINPTTYKKTGTLKNLVNQYSIMWEFCGNNTLAKIKVAQTLSENLKRLNNKTI